MKDKAEMVTVMEHLVKTYDKILALNLSPVERNRVDGVAEAVTGVLLLDKEGRSVEACIEGINKAYRVWTDRYGQRDSGIILDTRKSRILV
jgi:hypothetical protein